MAKQIDHDAISSASTVALETGKGVVGGVLTAGVIGAAVLGGITAIFSFGAVPLMAAVGFAVGAIGGGAIGAGAGAIAGAAEGVGKVGDEKAAFQAKSRAIAAQPVVAQAQQQAYMAGVQDGQASVVQELQRVQAEQEAQASFAAKVGKKGAITPESIIAQREAASGLPPRS